MNIQNISVEKAKEWLDNDDAILIDVREPAEYASEKISKSYLYPVGKICLSDLPKQNKKILIHCQKGMRGTNACKKLITEDDTLDGYNIEGGIEAWRTKGFETIKGEKNILSLDRQVQLIIGLSILLFGLLGYFLNPVFSLGSAFFGVGLTNAGLTGWCGLAKLIAKMPWNKV